MDGLKIFLLLLCMCSLRVNAQESKVQLIEQTGVNAVFYVTVPYAKLKDMEQDAQLAVFKAIMFDGLENFNDGKPLVERNTTYTADFLNTDKNKNAVFVKGIHHEGGERQKKINNRMIVVVNHKSLLSTLKRTGAYVE